MSPRWRLAEFALVLGVALVCLVFQLWLPSTHVDEKDYQEVGRVLAAEAQPGDAVLLAPWWTERARIYVPPNLEVVGYQGSELDDLELHPRVWVLSEPKLPKADYGGFYEKFAPSRTAVGQMREFGNLRLQLFTNGRSKPLTFSAGELLGQSQVYVETPQGERTPCSWDGRAFRCPQSQVLLEWREIYFAPHHCIRFWPPGGASKLVLELPPVPASASVGLRAGLTWDKGYYHDARLSPVELGVEVDGQVATTLTVPVAIPGVKKAQTPPVHEGARVRVTAQAQNAESRELCIEVYGFGAGGGGT